MSQAAFITGGTKRIGLTIAKALAAQGYGLVLQSRDLLPAGAWAGAAELRDAGAPFVHVVQADLQCPHSRADLLTNVLALAPDLELLVANAAAFDYDHAMTATAERLQGHLAVNFMAPVELVTSWAQHRQALGLRNPGHAVLMLDQKVRNLNPDYYTYTLSKLALASAVPFLAQSLAPVLRVNAIAPGITYPSEGMSTQDFEKGAAVAALGVSNSAQDLADAVCALTRIPSITGQTLMVDGGQHLVPRRRDVAFAETPLRP